MIHDLYLRAHVVVSGDIGEQPERASKRSRSTKLWPDYALVWDTETTLDLEQALNFGVWRFCQLEGAEYVAVQEGIFYRDGLAAKDIQTILAYRKKHLADDLARGADPQLTVLSRAEFVERVFWESVRAGALIVGFNLSFDISRIAVDWTAASNGGFSFVLSQLSKTKLNNVHRPRVRIAPLNGVAEQIELTAVRWEKEQHRWRRFRPLDLHTLAFALTDESYSLASAIRAFDSQPQKMEHDPTGLVTDEEITYARRDVHGTLGLLNALKREYELHPIDLLPDRAYSPASIGKAYLRAMGVAEPMCQFKDIPPKIHGIAMAAYYGGRAECRIRRWPVPVVPVDLTSEYPSVDALLGIWDLLTAERMTMDDVTVEVRALLERITLEDLFRPAFWKQLNFYARIVPEGDILPVRSVYDSKSGTCNIGLNKLHWKQSMWVAGPDLIAAVLLGDHIPNIQEAVRLVPIGKQKGLKPVKLRGAIAVDPQKEDFFTRVIEYRKQNKHNDRLQYFLKILANSTSYGTYLELNPVKVDASNRPKITVYSGEHIFEQSAPDTIEQPGSFYFPLLGALITSGGRLLLAMIERCVRDAGGTYLCCDTDALTIVASKQGGMVQMPDGAPPIKALSWKAVEQITERFDSLSPYNRDIVPHLLRLTDENYDESGAQRQLFGLSIAAKRYALYTTKCNQPYCSHSDCVTIVDPKAHGLIFFAPSEERESGLPKWWWELWRFLVALEFKQIIDPDFNVLMFGGRAIDSATSTPVDGEPEWISLPAMMKMRISTPHYLEQMKGKASPFGFVLHPRTRGKEKLTLLTPFSKNRGAWAHSVCVNTHDGKVYSLDELSRANVIHLGDVLCGYIQHAEIKSLAPDGEKCKAHTRGLLCRMTIKGGLQHCIGKEVSRFEQGKDDFIENIDDACIHYDGGRVAANETTIAEISGQGLRKTAKQTGLDRKTVRAIIKGKKVKIGTLAKVVTEMWKS
ncbi:MAG TPA: hypothetical protein VGR93_01650 [Candidatus Acidoferrales bacterium]|nr:hypothetical protein [Candidatus Acidoferrales bacterium]